MGAVRFRMSGELLRQALHMPPSSRFIAASVPWSDAGDNDWVEFVVSDNDIPGDITHPHSVDPTVHQVFWNWNVGSGGDT